MVANTQQLLPSQLANESLVPSKSTADTTTLTELNLGFIYLLRESLRDSSSITPLAPRRLLHLSAAAAWRVARCPYALFDVRGLLVDAPLPIDEAAIALKQFASAALFYVWHTAQRSPNHARLWFGLDAKAIQQLRTTSIRELTDVAVSRAASLIPILSSQPRFWRDLLQHAAAGDESSLQLTTWMGRQLLLSA